MSGDTLPTMTVLDETWFAYHARVRVGDDCASGNAAEFSPPGLTTEDEDGGPETSEARAKLAAAAPDLARALLAIVGAKMVPLSVKGRIVAALHKAGVTLPGDP